MAGWLAEFAFHPHLIFESWHLLPEYIEAENSLAIHNTQSRSLEQRMTLTKISFYCILNRTSPVDDSKDTYLWDKIHYPTDILLVLSRQWKHQSIV